MSTEVVGTIFRIGIDVSIETKEDWEKMWERFRACGVVSGDAWPENDERILKIVMDEAVGLVADGDIFKGLWIWGANIEKSEEEYCRECGQPRKYHELHSPTCNATWPPLGLPSPRYETIATQLAAEE